MRPDPNVRPRLTESIDPFLLFTGWLVRMNLQFGKDQFRVSYQYQIKKTGTICLHRCLVVNGAIFSLDANGSEVRA